jgi:hypothetical protein
MDGRRNYKSVKKKIKLPGMGRGYFEGGGVSVSLQKGVLVGTGKGYFHTAHTCSLQNLFC